MAKNKRISRAHEKEIQGYLNSLTALRQAMDDQAELIKTNREKAEFFQKTLAEREKQMDELIKAHADELKAHKDIIEFLLSRYHKGDPREKAIGPNRFIIKMAFADEPDKGGE